MTSAPDPLPADRRRAPAPRRRPASSRAGRLLPSEAELSRDLRRQPGHGPPGARGAARRGAGRLPPGLRVVRGRRPGAPALGRLGTIESQLAARGHALRAADPRLRASSPRPPRVRELLGRRHGAAGPAAQPGRRRAVRPGHGVVPRALGAELSRADVERSPFYELLASTLGGAVQTIGAAAASAARRRAAGSARRLAGAALRADHVDRRRASRCWSASTSSRPTCTEFVVDLPHAEASIAPSGLRLVE